MPVTFDEPKYARQSAPTRKRSFLVRSVISMGLASDEKSANRALIVVLVVVILLTLGLWVFASGGSQEVEPPPEPIV